MSLLLWGSLIVLAVTSVGGTTLTVIRAIELIRTFRAFGGVVASGADRILTASATMEKRLQVGGPAERFSRSAAELERSLATAKVLLREIRRLRTTMVGVRALVPRK